MRRLKPISFVVAFALVGCMAEAPPSPEATTERVEAPEPTNRVTETTPAPTAPEVKDVETGRGSGAGFGGRGKRVPRVRQAKAKITGNLERDAIRRVVRSHINDVRSCYNASLTKCPNLQGRTAVEFVITATGKVGSAEVVDTTLKNPKVASCIAEAVERWTFPKPKGGGSVTVVYPFSLSPG